MATHYSQLCNMPPRTESSSDTARRNSGEAMDQGSFRVRCYVALCGPLCQVVLKLPKTVTAKEVRALMWTKYLTFLSANPSLETYPPISPDVEDYELSLATVSGDPVQSPLGNVPLTDPIKPHLPKPCHLTLVVGKYWVERDLHIRHEECQRLAIEESAANTLVAMQSVEQEYRELARAAEAKRREEEARKAAEEKRLAHARQLREDEEERARRELAEFRARQREYEREYQRHCEMLDQVDRSKRILLAMSAILLKTQHDVLLSYERGCRAYEEKLKARVADGPAPLVEPPVDLYDYIAANSERTEKRKLKERLLGDVAASRRRQDLEAQTATAVALGEKKITKAFLQDA